jgi:uncharacterized protein
MGSRFAIFLATILSIWGAVHFYVFWRLSSVPWIAPHFSKRGLALVAFLLWSSYFLARLLGSWRVGWLALPLEFLAALWIGTLFLLFAGLLSLDMVTLGGWLIPRYAALARGWVALAVVGLSLLGMVLGLRAPVLREYEVAMPGLPRERDGLTVAVISDLHLGTLLGPRWAEGVVRRVNDLKPDLVLVVGDVIDGNVGRVEPLVPVLKQLHAPLGTLAVTGNHEYYAGVERSVSLFEQAGWTVLRDRAAEAAPGLVIAGVDDLTARFHSADQSATRKALADRPPGATIFLSHTPWAAEVAAQAGAGLMLCGHTHNGQIWPFNYLVGLRYPYMGGRYKAGGMPVIVCRGTGTWGPRMRLWRPSEILRLTLRAR